MKGIAKKGGHGGCSKGDARSPTRNSAHVSPNPEGYHPSVNNGCDAGAILVSL